ncbi:unnamed protein product [Cladocopium goreaui]|uniref:Uncharacterized protein n=1 Tax=Cladocopium goreaui TaxID=2562237 RepID=A0A9P1G9N2_9DINO|nr:unnamed protein product [Cladocopium goreaui]
MGEDFSWEDISVVTIQDRTEPARRTVASDTTSTSTSESDAGEEWLDFQTEVLQLEGDKEPLSFDDLFGEENSTAQAQNTDLPSLSEAESQLLALRARRARIVSIAQRYSGQELPGTAKAQVRAAYGLEVDAAAQVRASEASALEGSEQSLSTVEAPSKEALPSQTAVESSKSSGARNGYGDQNGCSEEGLSATERVLQRLRKEGLGDGQKIREGLVKDQERADELWRGFLCDDMPVGGDALPDPDEFYRGKR